MKDIIADISLALSFGQVATTRMARHFLTMLHDQINERGFNSRDEDLFDQAFIEAESYLLAEQAMDMMQSEFASDYALSDFSRSELEEDLPARIRGALAHTTGEYLKEVYGGLDKLIERAANGPLPK